MYNEIKSQNKDLKEAIKLIRKIAHEEFRNFNQDDQLSSEEILIEIENACLDFLEDRGL
jgi:hypothetical protein